ncbi:MAG: sigma-70 family RNA polymerase sigma factor [Armatimonadota bacterium]
MTDRQSSGLDDVAIEELVRRARQGDRDAFEKLVDEYKDKIYNYVARMLNDRDRAEDVAQETFIRAYTSLPNFRGASSFQTWLYRIASNLAIDTMRRRSYREGEFSLDETLQTREGEVQRQVEDEGPGPEKTIQNEELRAQIEDAIVELSPKLRTVIVLYELQGLSYKEIAEVVGAPLGTIKSRLFNAREQLREILEKKLDMPVTG